MISSQAALFENERRDMHTNIAMYIYSVQRVKIHKKI